MNDPNAPSLTPPAGAATALPMTSPPPGLNEDEHAPITSGVSAVESILRQPRRVLWSLQQSGSGRLIALMVLISVVCGAGYGAVIGTFSGGTQLWAAPLKVAGGLILSALICLPSLYIFACLSGSHVRLAEIFGLISGLILLMTVLLIGFAPVAWIFSQSTESVAAMGLLHLAFWAISTYFGLRFLNAGFSAQPGCSRGGIRVWMIIFVLAMLQMTTAVRPLIGTADTVLPTEKKFFVSHWMECIKQNKESAQNNSPGR